MPDQAAILIVEDDADLSRALAGFLEEQGYAVTSAADVPQGRAALRASSADLCLVDIVMPGPSGRVFCREVVEQSDRPVIMMSSLSDSDTVIALLELGADDYIVKPFEMGEMLARIRAVLRRNAKAAAQAGPQASAGMRFGPWGFEPGERRLRHADGFSVKLTPSETGILRFMLASPGTVFSREDLLAVSRTRQHGGADDRAIDNLMKRLRKKVEADTSAPRHLVTVWGKGYRFDL